MNKELNAQTDADSSTTDGILPSANLAQKTMSQFTEQDASEIGEPLQLLHKWEFVMNTLWSFFLAYSEKEKNVKPFNKANVILLSLKDGHKFKIFVDIYNRKYLSLSIEIEGHEDFAVSINNIDKFGKEGILRTVSNILTYAENVK